MQISNINSYNCSFTSLLKKQTQQKEDYTLTDKKGRIRGYEMKDDMLFVKGKVYTGLVRVDYPNGRKEHRDYEDGRVVRSDLNGDGVAKMFYAYKTNSDGTVIQNSFFEGDDALEPKS